MCKLFLLLYTLLISIPGAYSTTIAWDGSEMACDTQVTEGSRKFLDYSAFQKVREINGKIVGCSGPISEGIEFMHWIENPKLPRPATDNLHALVWDQSGCWEYTGSTSPIKVKAPYAIGSGGDYAIGAMEAGASAHRAVRVSCKWDLNTSGVPKVFRLAKPPMKPIPKPMTCHLIDSEK